MTEKTNGSGKAEESEATTEIQVQVQVVAQYIKDLSFENPNIERFLTKPPEGPTLKLEVNVRAERLRPDFYESAIAMKAVATLQQKTIYDLEIVYAGLFKLQNIPEAALEPFLLINCPILTFPFLRRLVADITREGGFPPLLLDPIDFAGLYMRRDQEKSASGTV